MMSKRINASLILGAAATMAIGFAVTSSFAQQTGVKIGLFTPLSGASSVVGLDMQRGVELAFERINAGFAVPLRDGTTRMIGPGLLGGPIQLIVEDDESRPQAAMDAVRKLVEVDRVAMVLGEYSSGRTLPTGQFTNENRVPHISIGANSAALRDIGPYFFDAIGLASLQGPALISLAQSEMSARTVATFLPNNPYGVSVEIAVCEAAVAAGMQCIQNVRYEEQKTTYQPELQQVTGPDPDVVVFFAYGADATLILRQAYELGIDTAGTWLGTEVSNWVADVAAIPQAAEGIRGIEHDVSGQFYQTQYADAYQAKYGEAPLTAFGAFGYDAAMLAALAIAQAGSTDPDAIRTALLAVSAEYQGLTGNMTFDEDGMRLFQDYGTFIYTNGALQPYTPAAR